MSADETSLLAFDEFRFDPVTGILFCGMNQVRLGGRAAALLSLLLHRPGEVVGATEIIRRVWPELLVDELNVAVQVSALRKILGKEAIENVPPRGYRFTRAVNVCESDRSRC
jgi:DNA-binding winged helix-turn-helix (wHTH) protein